MTSNELIDISVDIGAALLENGAEIYRVEESIARICYAYGATETNIYAVLSSPHLYAEILIRLRVFCAFTGAEPIWDGWIN